MKIYLKYSLLACLMSCWAMADLQAQCTLSATSSGGNGGYSQVYVLVDAGGNIVAQNTTGTFAAVATGTYQIHALNYDPFNPPAPLPSALIGQPVSNVGTTTAGCFNADFLTDYVVRACGSCQQTSTVCETDAVVATSSGGNTAYTQLYVLVDAATGTVVATNGTGTFTGMVVAGNSYQVYALNYNPANAPAPLPTVGQAVTMVGTATAGCYNSDFLTDYVCFNITSCATSCVQNNNVCENTNITATASGFNASYTQVYVLTDDSGNFLAQNSTGTFATTGFAVGNVYHVHALNYDPSNPPAPLPSALTVGASISSISGGCFNGDFLTDYVCYTITACAPTCFAQRNVCENEAIIVSSSGTTAGYTQVYVLTDDSGNFLAQNTTGVFSTLGFTLGDTYHVHALNYNPANPPAPLPSAMTVGMPISTISGGCFNGDFLTDYLCYTIGCPCTGKLVQYAPNQAIAGSAGTVQYTVASAYCDDVDGWRYYYDPAEPNDLLFAMEHKPTGGNSNDFTARVTIGVNDHATTTGYDEPISGQDMVNFEANFGMGRYWDVDVLSGSLNGNVNVRFYYKEAEYNTASAAATAWETANEPAAIAAGHAGLTKLAPYWFKTNDATAYVPAPDLQPTTVNSNNILVLNADYMGTNAQTITNNKNYVQFDQQISSFSGGTVAFRVTPDPLLLEQGIVHFNGLKVGANNQLFWSTNNENGVVEYILERSEDAIHAEAIAAQLPTGQQTYIVLDEAPLPRLYYRLKVVLQDGSFEYTNWVVLERKRLNDNNVHIYPNPTSGQLTLDIVTEEVTMLNITVTDVLGRELLQNVVISIIGSNQINLDVSHLPSAMYVLKIGEGATQIIRKITKL